MLSRLRCLLVPFPREGKLCSSYNIRGGYHWPDDPISTTGRGGMLPQVVAIGKVYQEAT